MGAHRSGHRPEIGLQLNGSILSDDQDEAPTRRFYGRRQGRKLRVGQAEHLAETLPEIRVPAQPGLDPVSLFDPKPDQLWLEIGFGGGEHLAGQAANHPEIGFIGAEPFINGVVKLLGVVERQGLNNIRVWPDDVRLLLDHLPDQCLDRVFILFPDPWPKTRHHRRRIVCRPNLDRLSALMRDGAELRMASDDVDYIDWMLFETRAQGDFEWTARRPADWQQPPADWYPTRYQQKAAAKGIGATFLTFKRRPR